MRAIPGGLKNALDRLVSTDVIIAKPVALAHASHRGNDMLAALRLVLRTVSQAFDEESFLRFSLLSKTTDEVGEFVGSQPQADEARRFLEGFARKIRVARDSPA